jgi:hypothetical protein
VLLEFDEFGLAGLGLVVAVLLALLGVEDTGEAGLGDGFKGVEAWGVALAGAGEVGALDVAVVGVVLVVLLVGLVVAARWTRVK